MDQQIYSREQFSPVFITSSVPRSGTTLLQRLVSSSSNAICYGEACFMDLVNITKFSYTRINTYAGQNVNNDRMLLSVLKGDVNIWLPELFPEVAFYFDTLLNTMYSLPAGIQNYCNMIKRPVWGAKNPNVTVETISLLFHAFPEAKIVYLYRDIFGVARSAKARRFINNSEELSALCQKWSDNLRDITQPAIRAKPGLWVVNYDEFVSNPDEYIAKFESFSGIKDIDRSVMEVKINTFKGEKKDGYSETNYIEPESLTEEEKEIITKICHDQINAFCLSK